MSSLLPRLVISVHPSEGSVGYPCWDTALQASLCVHHSLHQAFRRTWVALSSQICQLRPDGWGSGTTDDSMSWGGRLFGVPRALLAGNPGRFQTGDHTNSAWNLLLLGHGNVRVKEGLWAGSHSLGQPGHEFQWLWVTHKERLQGL